MRVFKVIFVEKRGAEKFFVRESLSYGLPPMSVFEIDTHKYRTCSDMGSIGFLAIERDTMT